ncbi:MAG: PEP/pyruvate-binding domain-containing protein, partial [Vulcanimicrobiaceae bacterium]
MSQLTYEAPITALARPIRFFDEGPSGGPRELLGGKGAGLAEMTRAGLPVPPGFTITTEVCRAYLAAGGRFPEGLETALAGAMRELERRTGKRFGDARDPLLVSVRSGARVSMPGMMDTILNLGLNDATVGGLAALSGNPRFAWDAYRRFVAMYGAIVLAIEKEHFDEIVAAERARSGASADAALDAAALERIVRAGQA